MRRFMNRLLSGVVGLVVLSVWILFVYCITGFPIALAIAFVLIVVPLAVFLSEVFPEEGDNH